MYKAIILFCYQCFLVSQKNIKPLDLHFVSFLNSTKKLVYLKRVKNECGYNERTKINCKYYLEGLQETQDKIVLISLLYIYLQ